MDGKSCHVRRPDQSLSVFSSGSCNGASQNTAGLNWISPSPNYSLPCPLFPSSLVRTPPCSEPVDEHTGI